MLLEVPFCLVFVLDSCFDLREPLGILRSIDGALHVSDVLLLQSVDVLRWIIDLDIFYVAVTVDLDVLRFWVIAVRTCRSRLFDLGQLQGILLLIHLLSEIFKLKFDVVFLDLGEAFACKDVDGCLLGKVHFCTDSL